MQDKNLHIDQKFTDRAWREMKALLDEEMPAPERKKPLAVWWLSGTLAVAALFSAIYFFTLYKPEKIKEKEKTEFFKSDNPIAQTQKEKNIEKNIYTENADKTSAPKIAPAVIGKKKKKTSIADRPKKENLGTLGQPADKQAVESGTNNVSTEKQVAAEINKREEKIIENKNTENRTGAFPKNIPTTELTATELIAQFISENNPALIDPVNASKKQNNHILYASVMGVPHTKTQGANVGYMRPLFRSPKGFVFAAGLGYSFINQPMYEVVTDVFLISSSDPALGSYSTLYDISYASNESLGHLDMAFLPNAAITISNQPTDQLHLHYLSVPLQGKYHVDKWFFSAGVQTNFLLFAFNNTLNGGLLKKGKGITARQETLDYADAFNQRSADGEKATLSNFDLTATVGTGFQLSDHFGIQLQYNHGMKDIIRVNYQTDYNRMLQLTAAYSW